MLKNTLKATMRYPELNAILVFILTDFIGSGLCDQLPERYKLKRNIAEDFARKQQCGTESEFHRELFQNCCTYTCYWEEINEYSKTYTWDKVNDALCKFSIQEKWYCQYYNRDGEKRECADHIQKASCICGPSKKWCGIGRMCYEEQHKCNGINDCGNWEDEKNCKEILPKGMVTALITVEGTRDFVDRWYCAVSKDYGILAATKYLYEARIALGSGHHRISKIIVPMIGKKAGNPESILQSWNFGSSWWEAKDIEKFKKQCEKKARPGYVCDTTSNLDYPGNDIASYEGITLNRCKLACSARRKCRGYTFSAASNTCWIKRKLGSPKSVKGLTSGKCYKLASGKWYCAVSLKDGVVEKASNYEQAKSSLRDSKKKQVVIRMHGLKVKKTHKYWGRVSSEEIFLMKQKCLQTGTKPACQTTYFPDDYDDDGPNSEFWGIQKSCKKYPKEAKMEGTILIGGRPICHEKWDKTDAYVACKSMGFSRETKAFAHHDSNFGKVNNHFILTDVSCDERNTKLQDCDFSTITTCEFHQQAGVTCIDPKLLTFDKTGVASVGYYRFCSDGWGLKESITVCNTFLGKHFSKRNYQVPVFQTNHIASIGDFFILNTKCIGSEKKSISECEFDVGRKCDHVVSVQCAKCTPEKLLKILGQVKMSSDLDIILESIKLSRESLRSSCYNWDCGKDTQYQEYCKIRGFLEEAESLIKHKTESNILYKEVNYAERLKHQFMNEKFDKITVNFDKTDKNIKNVIVKLSEYFTTNFKYEEERNQADYYVLESSWTFHNKKIEDTAARLQSHFQDLVGFTTGTIAAEIADAVSLVFLAVSAFGQVPPDPGSIANAMIELKGQIKNLERKYNQMAELTYIMEHFYKFVELMESIKKAMEKNKEHYVAMAKVAKAHSSDNINLTDCKKVIELGKNVTLSSESNDRARMISILSNLIERTCDLFNENNGILAVKAVALGLGVCPRTKEEVDALAHHYDKMEKLEADFDVAIKSISAAKLAQNAAARMRMNLEDTLMQEVDVEIAKYNTIALLRNYKIKQVSEACAHQTYLEHGIESKRCKELKRNPDASLLGLVDYQGFKQGSDYMCPEGNVLEKIVDIPVGRSQENKTLPKGTLDLVALIGRTGAEFQEGETDGVFFQIPNDQWLIDNRWLTKAQIQTHSPFFLKSMSVYPFPLRVDRSLEITTSMKLLRNELNGVPYNIKDAPILQTIVKTHEVSCSHSVDSPYDLPLCPQIFPKVCVIKPGEFPGPFYPSLIGSQWWLQLDFPREKKLPEIFPETKLYLKAKVKICQSQGDLLQSEMRDDPFGGSGSCCSDKPNHFYDREAEIRGQSPCRPCPVGSRSSLSGNYCEKCPEGYAPHAGAFGCHKQNEE